MKSWEKAVWSSEGRCSGDWKQHGSIKKAGLEVTVLEMAPSPDGDVKMDELQGAVRR